MTWWKPWTWFKKGGSVQVEVILDKGFGAMHAANDGDPATYSSTLFISDLNMAQAIAFLNGRSFDWHIIPLAWRHNLEINGLRSATQNEVRAYLKDGK